MHKNWEKQNRWNPLGVIETFLDLSLNMHDGLEDFVWVLEKIGCMRFSSNDTKRAVKTVRKTENRFTGYNGVDEANNK